MGSIGFKRQYETDALFDFAMLLKYLSEISYPGNTELQTLARRAALTYVMAANEEEVDMKSRNIIRDRLQDCADCKRWTSEQPCIVNGHHSGPCKYNSFTYKAGVIREKFGDKAIEIIKKYPMKEMS